METNRLLEQLRRAYKESGLSLRRVSIQSEVPYASVHGIFMETRNDITLRNAARICEVLGLEFSPMRRNKGKETKVGA